MNLVSKSFSVGKISVFEIPYIDMVEEMLDEIIDIIDTKYYKYIKNLLESGENKPIWGWIKNLDDVYKRTEMFRELAKDIRDNGFDFERGQVVYIENKPYGKITGIVQDNEFVARDGHHRLSVLIHLGVKEFEIVDNLYLIPKQLK